MLDIACTSWRACSRTHLQQGHRTVTRSSDDRAQSETTQPVKRTRTVREQVCEWPSASTEARDFWLFFVRHAAFLISRLGVGSDCIAANPRANDCAHSSNICPFGELVMFRVPVFAHRVTQGGKKQHETEARWSRRLCLGKAEDYGTPLVRGMGLKRHEQCDDTKPRHCSVRLHRAPNQNSRSTKSRTEKFSSGSRSIAE